jgi:hypothetical protein
LQDCRLSPGVPGFQFLRVSVPLWQLSYRRRPPRIMRSTDACPPPVISSARAIPRNATASSMPAGAKKAGQSTPKIATSITHAIRNAPTRVNNPNSTRTPPTSSDTAAAPIHNHAGRMNGYGAGKDVNFAQPGPLNEPRTFCAPCPVKAIPSASLSGTVAHKEDVDVSFRSMALPFPQINSCFETRSTINPFTPAA